MTHVHRSGCACCVKPCCCDSVFMMCLASDLQCAMIANPVPPGDAAVSSLEQHLASLLPSAQPAAAGSDPNSTLSRAMQRRVHHNIQLAARCAHLESQKQALEAEQAQLRTKLDKAQVSCTAGRRVP